VLTRTERRILFLIFCGVVIGAAYAEYKLSLQGFSIANVVWTIVAGLVLGGVLAGSAKLFLRIISKNFLDLGVTPSRLHEYSSERARLITEAQRLGTDEYPIREELVRNTLKFSEAWLKGWVPGTHFEFCVFVDREMPLIFAYFDSGKDSVSRSMKERQNNPKYYIERGYEVVKLLQSPNSQVRILKDTTKTDYAFTSNSQREQLKSTILMCPNVEVPLALVLSSNEKDAFRGNDTDVILFFKYVAESVYGDLVEGNFLNRIRNLKPELFKGMTAKKQL
jgi:hypothetical protein